MTKERLKKYGDNKRELSLIRRQMQEVKVETVVVKASMHCFPYLPATVTVTGYNARSMQRIRRRKYWLVSEQHQIEDFIAAIPDGYMRSIFELRYIQGLSWAKVAKKMQVYTPPDSLRMAADRYLARLLKD